MSRGTVLLAFAVALGCGGESEADRRSREAEEIGNRALAYSKSHPTPDAMPPVGLDAAALPNADMRPDPPKRVRGNLALRLRFARDVTTIQQSMGAARNVRIRVDGTVLVFDGDPGCDREGLRKILDGIAGFDDFAPAGFTALRCGEHGDVLPLEW